MPYTSKQRARLVKLSRHYQVLKKYHPEDDSPYAHIYGGYSVRDSRQEISRQRGELHRISELQRLPKDKKKDFYENSELKRLNIQVPPLSTITADQNGTFVIYSTKRYPKNFCYAATGEIAEITGGGTGGQIIYNNGERDSYLKIWAFQIIPMEKS